MRPPCLVVSDNYRRPPSLVHFMTDIRTVPRTLFVEHAMPMHRWKPPRIDEEVTEFLIERSLDDGRTFAPYATIPNNTSNSTVYDAAKGKFFFNDPDPRPDALIRIAARNEAGLGPWRYAHTPPEPIPMTNIYGTILTPRGEPIRSSRVTVRTVSPRISSGQKERVLVMGDNITIHTDEHGRWQVNLARGIIVSIAFEGKKYTFRVPQDREVLHISETARYAVSER